MGTNKKCIISGKYKDRCNCGKEGCGKSLCKNTGKRRECCKCPNESCGKSFCKKTGKRKAYCSCGNDLCGKDLCITTGKHRYKCRCGNDSCGKSFCKDTGIEKTRCHCNNNDCGGERCKHNKRFCKECDLNKYLIHNIRVSIKERLKSKDKSSIEYLGCSIDTFKSHIESQFKEGMSWENHGSWHIDHVKPIKYKEDGIEPDLEEIKKRFHYLNTQPLWATENISKGSRYIG